MPDIFLTVPFAQKDEAKALGARWDGGCKQWFVPNGTDPAPFQKWAEITMDASKWTRFPVGTPKLYVDLVPQSAWFPSLRNGLAAGEWDMLKKTAFRLAQNKCEVCYGQGANHPVEAHERWAYTNTTGTQKFLGISALCPACRQSAQLNLFDFAVDSERCDAAMEHLKTVNTWNSDQADGHIRNAYEEWIIRDAIAWKLDLNWLKTCGIDLSTETRLRLEHYESLGFNGSEKPSEVVNGYWVHASRLAGAYPSHSVNRGKWLIFTPLQHLDDVWVKIKLATEQGKLGDSAKAATAKPNSNATDWATKVICVYTYDWTDEADVRRIREELRTLGITSKIPYKTNKNTKAGSYINNGDTGISEYYE